MSLSNIISYSGKKVTVCWVSDPHDILLARRVS